MTRIRGLQTKGVFAANCVINGDVLTIGLLVLLEAKSRCKLTNIDGGRVVEVDLDEVAEGTHYDLEAWCSG